MTIRLNIISVTMIIGWILQGCFSKSTADKFKHFGRNKNWVHNTLQLLPVNGDLCVLVKDENDEIFYGNPIILFLNKIRDVTNAAELPTNKIDSIRNGKVYYLVNEDSKRLLGNYEGAFPEEFRMHPIVLPAGSFLSYSNKLILDVSVLDSGIVAIVKKSENLFYASDWKPWGKYENFESGFTVMDTLSFSYCQLTLNYKLQEVNFDYTLDDGSRYIDRMIFKNKSIQEKFYGDLYNRFMR